MTGGGGRERERERETSCKPTRYRQVTNLNLVYELEIRAHSLSFKA